MRVKLIFIALLYCFLVEASSAFVTGCSPDGRAPESVSWDDPRVLPLVKAMEEVDRASMGFTPISKTARLKLEGPHKGPGNNMGYDAMLHIYGDPTRRTVAFRRTPEGYKWIFEQEVHSGPNKVEFDGTYINEFIDIEFQIEPVNGVPLNRTYILYEGEDSRLAGRENLTLDYIRPILEEWRQTR